MDARTGLPVVGMVGAGQLARMSHQAAIALGQTLRVLAVNPDDSAALVTPDVILGTHTDLDALRRFADGCDVVTFDHEHVPGEHIQALAASGVRIYPGADALQYAQDKALMRAKLAGIGAPVPAFEVVPARPRDELSARLRAFAGARGLPMVVKTARGGYDGRGVWTVRHDDDIAAVATDLAGRDLVLEEFVPMRRELAALVARSPFGQAAAWPVAETVQQDGICVQVIAPAPGLADETASAASSLALNLAAKLDVVGVMAVELFEVEPGPGHPDGIMVNELAMRPHNSGHWTMDGAVTSQFEQHLRAVLDYPLGATEPRAAFAVMGNVLGGADPAGAALSGADPAGAVFGSADPAGAALGIDERVHHLAARFPEVKVHLYGKSFRPGRKLGHVNVIGSDLADLRRRATLAATWLGAGVWADGYDVQAGSAAVPAPVAERAQR